jgi:hypothetical protein
LGKQIVLQPRYLVQETYDGKRTQKQDDKGEDAHVAERQSQTDAIEVQSPA